MADVTFVEQINSFVVRVATECKTIYGKIGSLDSLSMAEKGNLVAAVNSVYSQATGIAADLAAVTARVKALDEAKVGAIDVIKAEAAALTGRVVTLEEGLEALQTQVDELTQIDDANAEATDTTYSASKIESRIAAEKAALKADLLNGAGEAYDTLKELGDLIDANKNVIDALKEVAAGHVHFDKAQTLTDAQKIQARSNISAASQAAMTAVEGRATAVEGRLDAIEADYLVAADKEELKGMIESANGDLDAYKAKVGDLTTNFVTTFENALA